VKGSRPSEPKSTQRAGEGSIKRIWWGKMVVPITSTLFSRMCGFLLAALLLNGCAGTPAAELPAAPIGQQEPLIRSIEKNPERSKKLLTLTSMPQGPLEQPAPGMHAELTAYVQGLLNKFITHSPTPSRRVHTVVADCEAFTDETQLNGTLKFCAETLRHLGSESEIAFIVAHETSHAILGHTQGDRERLAAQEKSVHTTYFFLGPNARTIAETQVANENAALRKSQEQEADFFGVDLMVKAGFNPNGAYTFYDLKRRSILAKLSYRDANLEEQKNRIDRSVQAMKDITDLGSVTAFAIMNKTDDAIMANLNDNDHEVAEARMKAIALYNKQHYQSHTARPLGALPWKSHPKQFVQTAHAFSKS
jgi:hypothetical protein